MKQRLSFILVLLLVISSINTGSALAMEYEEEQSGIGTENNSQRKLPQKKQYSKSQKNKIKEIDDVSEISGLETAELLEDIEDDGDLYEYTLKNTLEKYYDEPEVFQEQLEEIKKEIESPAAEDIILEYESALEERNLQDELNYSTENIIVVFEPETDDSYIKLVAEEQYGELVY